MAEVSEVRRVGVVGTGTMGFGIGIVAGRGGFDTVVYDVEPGKLDRVKKEAAAFFQKSVRIGKMSESAAAECLARIRTTASVDDLGGCDLVIEAVFESYAVKRDLFARLGAACAPHTILASNTSTLSITQLGAASGRPDRFVGLHFCLPAQVMKLVEVTPGLETSDGTLATAWKFCERAGQIPIKTKDTPGFILNYFVIPFNNSAIRLVEQGVAEAKDIDTAVRTGLGHALGPLELVDLVGLDTQLLLCEAFYETTRDPRMACPHLVRQMVAAGRLGRKSGRGFYVYDSIKAFGT
jgi:3-hydroxybutyryl-CoA dehydrogenase